MKIREITMKHGQQRLKCFVSPLMESICDDNKTHLGYWWIIKGGEIASFTAQYPKSMMQYNDLQDLNVFECPPCNTKEEFINLIKQ
jgi:hypothetical protein